MKLTSIRVDMPPAEAKELVAVLARGGAHNVTLQAGESRRTPGNAYGQILFGLDVADTSCNTCGK
jgi:hypothetical protein